MYCPATRARCDRPCSPDECQRAKLDEGSYRVSGGVMENMPRPPAPGDKPVISSAQLRAARAYLDLTLEEICANCEVTPNTLSRFERSLSVPHEKTLRRIVGALWDMGIEVFGTERTHQGIRDVWPAEKRARWK